MPVRRVLADLDLDQGEREFRQQVEAFLAEGAAKRDPLQFFHGRGGGAAELYRELGRLGWLSLSWPESVGGRGLPPIYEFLLWDEMAYARAARAPIGAGLVARTIIQFGSEVQRARFLPAIAAGVDGYALGYSEPEAGSDLTGLRTRATRDGDVYRVTGEKRWTSDAHNSRWLWLLCRTGEPTSRSEGLSLLIVDLQSDGVDITPIETIDGHRLNEVRLDDVPVPIDHRIGPENQAWKMIREALARERHLQVLPGRVERDLEMLAQVLASSPSGTDSQQRSELARLFAHVLAVRTGILRSIRSAGDAEISPVAAAKTKIHGTALIQDIARAAVRLGSRSVLADTAEAQFLWRASIMETIAGGTTEVALDLLARHGLSTVG